MIKINLISEGRKPVVARKAKPKLSFGDQDPSALILGAGILIGVLVVGVWWYLLDQEERKINAAVAEANAEVERLRPIIAEVDQFKAKQAALENKITVIKDLKRKQQGPVHIMDEISKAIPDLLWLDRMTLQGTFVTLQGQAFNTSAIAAFIENLNRVVEFKEPDTKSIQQNRDGGSYSFQIHFSFVQQEPPPEAEEDAAAPAGGAPAAAGGANA